MAEVLWTNLLQPDETCTTCTITLLHITSVLLSICVFNISQILKFFAYEGSDNTMMMKKKKKKKKILKFFAYEGSDNTMMMKKKKKKKMMMMMMMMTMTMMTMTTTTTTMMMMTMATIVVMLIPASQVQRSSQHFSLIVTRTKNNRVVTGLSLQWYQDYGMIDVPVEI